MNTKIIIFLILGSSLIFSQSSDTTNNSSELDRIYANLEYNTSSFDDVKMKWVLTDPEMIRDLSNKFIANNYVRINGKNVDHATINDFNNKIALGNVAIDLRKRFYDDEIEYFAFILNDATESSDSTTLFDPITDGYYLRLIIGEKQYKELQKQTYFYTDLSKVDFSTKQGYNFDIHLNALNSEIMFWNTTSNNQNKYLISLFGDWGNENIHFPGWSFQQYLLGLQLTYYKKLPPDPRNYSYLFKIGTGIQTTVPYQTAVPEIPLLISGKNFYTKLSTTIFNKNMFVDLEGFMTISDYAISDYEFSHPTRYNSIRNFYSLNLRAIKIMNLADFGELEMSFGVATHDFNEYKYAPASGGIVDLIPYKTFMHRFNHFINSTIGLSKMGGLIQHKITLLFGYNPESYGYYGFSINFMISDTFGFDIRMRNSFGLENVNYPWRMDSYLVFSPIFRINY